MADDNKKLGQIIQNRYKFAKTQQEDIFEDFARYRQLWKSKITNPTDYPWDYALFNPMVFSTVRSFVARVATGNVGVNLQAWNEQGRPKTQVNKNLLDWEFQEAQLFLTVARAMFSVALYGKAFIDTGWCFQKARVIEEEDEQGNVTRRTVMSQSVNRADLSTVRVFDVFVANRNLPDLHKQPWIVIRRWKTPAEMEKYNESRGEEVYTKKVFDWIKKEKPFVRFVDYGSDVMTDDEQYEEAWKSGVLPILEMWDMQTGKVSEIIDGHSDMVLRSEDNPFYHGGYSLEEVSFFPEDDNFWNTGLVMPIEDLQESLNSTLNQFHTSARQQLNNMWITGDMRIPDWEFVSRPNGIIHTAGDINNTREVQHKDITQQALAMMGETKSEIERTTGINDLLAAGQPQGGVKAVGALNLEQSNLDQNLKLFLTMLEQVTLTRIATKFLKLNAQYITSEQVIGITGRHGYKNSSIKPDDVSAEFTPIIIPNSVLPKNPAIKLQNLQNTLGMAEKETKIAVNVAPIWQEMLSTMGMTDLDNIVPDDADEALEENEMMLKGISVECEVTDNHKVHIPIHQYQILKGQLTPEQTQLIIEHIKTHKLWELAQNPNLLDEMAGQAAAPGLPGAQQLTPGLPVGGVEGPGGPLPVPNPAVNEQGLIAQIGQQLGQTAAPNQPPVAIPNPGGNNAQG